MKTAICLDCGIVLAILTQVEGASHVGADGSPHTRSIVRPFIEGDVVGQSAEVGAVPAEEKP